MQNNWSNGKTPGFTKQFNEQNSISYIGTEQVLPQSFDWRNQKVVTEVKDQGMCGSCWAFAGIATIESAYAIFNNLTGNELIEFSEQEMIDCVTGYPYYSNGCDGGTALDVYRYATDSSLVKESDYPYVDKGNTQVV